MVSSCFRPAEFLEQFFPRCQIILYAVRKFYNLHRQLQVRAQRALAILVLYIGYPVDYILKFLDIFHFSPFLVPFPLTVFPSVCQSVITSAAQTSKKTHGGAQNYFCLISPPFIFQFFPFFFLFFLIGSFFSLSYLLDVLPGVHFGEHASPLSQAREG